MFFLYYTLGLSFRIKEPKFPDGLLVHSLDTDFQASLGANFNLIRVGPGKLGLGISLDMIPTTAFGQDMMSDPDRVTIPFVGLLELYLTTLSLFKLDIGLMYSLQL